MHRPPKPYFQSHGVTLYLGNCHEVLQSLRANSIDCVVTSPPYNQGLDRWSGGGMHADFATKMASRAYPDSLDEHVYQGQQLQLLSQLARVTRSTGSVFYNHKPRWRAGRLLHPLEWVSRCELKLRQEIVWAKNGGVAVNARMFCPSDERIYWLVQPSGRHKWRQDQVGHCTVWRIPKVGSKTHPCPFPCEIPKRCVLATTEPGDVVFDPYAGTGTTLAVAASLGRKAIGVEREERWAEEAAQLVERAAAGGLEV